MALGSHENVAMAEIPVATSTDRGTAHMRDPAIQTGVYGYDTERQVPRDRRFSRVAAPIPGTVGDSDAESAMSVGRQMELEKNNSIKYRTCSWQKVI